ncbi:MAG: NTP transferase domain-containing protein [Calditrichaeota bacterium]|nr:NTP transferase domain-containing protein [Calditrichota bacterium]
MEKQKTRALILAAGKGTRMNSSVSKVLHTILGKTILEYVVEALEFSSIERIGVIVGSHNIEEVRKVLNDRVDYIVQRQQLGTGHAVMSATDWLKEFNGSLLIMVGDAPFINSKIIKQILTKQQTGNKAVCFLTAVSKNPLPWGRVVRDKNGKVLRIVEEKDATIEEKKIREVSSSHYCFDWQSLKQALAEIDNNNVQTEYYLPDVIKILVKKGLDVETEISNDFLTSFGINTPADLEFAESQMKSIGQIND